MAPVLRGSQAWLSRETETMHVITGALMGEVQAARGMSSKGSQRMAGQDAQRTQALNLLLVSTLWRVLWLNSNGRSGHLRKNMWGQCCHPDCPHSRRKGDCCLVQWLTQVSKRKRGWELPNHSIPKLWLAQDFQRKALGRTLRPGPSCPDRTED